MAIIVAIAATTANCAVFSLIGKYSDISRSGDQGDALSIPGYRVAAPKSRTFAAGAASSDITPPPGFPTGGHGPAGDVARGYWIRLHSRAFFFEDTAGHALVLVTADLFAIPGGLRQKVAQIATQQLAKRGIEVSLPPEAFVIAATHTHHGPGNFLTARIQNQFGSSYPGFSEPLFNFLAERIADAVVSAAANAHTHPGPVELSVHVRQVGYELLRNRSPKTFLLNRNREEILARLNEGADKPECAPRPGEPVDGWEPNDCARLRAIDRTLTVLEVTRGTGESAKRLAALVFFAVHPSDLPAETPFYSPDFIGDAMLILEQRLRTDDAEPMVVGFFNGAEGDITARRRQRDLIEVYAFGRRFAREVEATLSRPGGRVSTTTGLSVRAGAFDPEKEGSCQPKGEHQRQVELAPSPVFGAATLGGAEDDRTDLYQLGWRDGTRDSASGPQGVKLPALDSRVIRGARFTSDFAPPAAFPHSLPLSVLGIGDFSLATLPLEASTAQGDWIRRRLQLPHGKLELVGLANEYVSYCASRDEYWAQDYMGASTLWGADEGPYLACRLDELNGAAPLAWEARSVPSAEYSPGTTPDPAFGPSFVGETHRPDDGLELILRDPQGLPERRLPWFDWNEKDAPSFDSVKERTVVIWTKENETWRPLAMGSPPSAESDHGDGFLTMFRGKRGWAAIWLRPLLTADGRDSPRPDDRALGRGAPLEGTFAFVVTSKNKVACSQEFTLAAGRAWPDEVEAAKSCAQFAGAVHERSL
jgi:neutral ceramidase